MESGIACVGELDGSRDHAVLIDDKICYALGTRAGIGLEGSLGESGGAVGLANAAYAGVLPGEMPVGAVSRTGVKELLFAVDVSDGNVIVELCEAGVGFEKDAAIPIADSHDIGLQAGGTSHGDKELCHLFAAAAFVAPDVIGGTNLLEAFGLLFSAAVLASVVGVFQLHDGGVKLAELLVLRV